MREFYSSGVLRMCTASQLSPSTAIASRLVLYTVKRTLGYLRYKESSRIELPQSIKSRAMASSMF